MKSSPEDKTLKEGASCEGDPVYEFLKGTLLPGHKVLKVSIYSKAVVAPGEARKIIEFVVENPKGVRKNFAYNYNKMRKRIS